MSEGYGVLTIMVVVGTLTLLWIWHGRWQAASEKRRLAKVEADIRANPHDWLILPGIGAIKISACDGSKK